MEASGRQLNYPRSEPHKIYTAEVRTIHQIRAIQSDWSTQIIIAWLNQLLNYPQHESSQGVKNIYLFKWKIILEKIINSAKTRTDAQTRMDGTYEPGCTSKNLNMAKITNVMQFCNTFILYHFVCTVIWSKAGSEGLNS